MLFLETNEYYGSSELGYYLVLCFPQVKDVGSAIDELEDAKEKKLLNWNDKNE